MYQFIHNIGDYFNPGYFNENFKDSVFNEVGFSSERIKEIDKLVSPLKQKYFDYKRFVISGNRPAKYIIEETHKWHTELLKVLGYDISTPYAEWYQVGDNSIIPVRHILRNGERPHMLIMEMQPQIATSECENPDGLFEQHYDSAPDSKEQRYLYSQWEKVIKLTKPEGVSINPNIINEAISTIFQKEETERPDYIVMLGGNIIYLIECYKWDTDSYLWFDLEMLWSEGSIPANKDYFALFYSLLCKDSLADSSQQIQIIDKLNEKSLDNAYSVTQDLKIGVIHAVESLANEAIYYMNEVENLNIDKYAEGFASDVRDDCLNIIYRLLFVFYAEARPEIGILPMNDPTYVRGYSLESLRDLELTRMDSNQSRDGYFIHQSLWTLFSLLAKGICIEKSFTIKKIDSPLFNDNKLKRLKKVRIRNYVWQSIICELSLSQEKNKKTRGRISYANLCVNQLGSVYESLLAYRGFYADQDYIEVHPANKPNEGTYLVERNRMDEFKSNEILCDQDGQQVILPQGTFVYRLNGRDRKNSASFYTPECLTKSTVKYTLKAFSDKLDRGEMKAKELLELKILEPAMGAAAFQNEVINQLAELYLVYRKKELNKYIEPNTYRLELQKVKAYIATHNVYGVDLNPTAIELGKLSLWLNVIHKDMETPFFSNRLALGNATVGAWLNVYSKKDVLGVLPRNSRNRKLIPTPWWEFVPHKVTFEKNKVHRLENEIYQFLLPDPSMLAVRSIKEQKQAHEEEDRLMSEKMKDWTSAIDSYTFELLKKMSRAIDDLLKQYFDFQHKIESYTNNKSVIWGIGNSGEIMEQYLALDSYSEKEGMYNVRYRHDNAYYRLKTIMDYWCSLWYWTYEKASILPTRLEYWEEINKILGLDMNVAATTIDSKSTSTKSSNIPSEQTEEEAEIIAKSKADIIINQSSHNIFSDSSRIRLVTDMADKYHFFHPMLEFLEVFWLRGGFDVICGNPPWLKLESDIIGVVSEKYPEVVIRSQKAPLVLSDALKVSEDSKNQGYFQRNPLLKKIYDEEALSIAAGAAFMNAHCNYPLLKGQQTNLYKCILENALNMMSPQGFMGLLHPETIYDDPNGQPLRREIYHRLRYHFQYKNELELFEEVGHPVIYGVSIYSTYHQKIDFLNINNLFHPATVDGCFVHDGLGICGGIKKNGSWNTSPHKDRIVHYTEKELSILANTFENSEDFESTKLVSVHAQNILDILSILSDFPHKVSDYDNLISECFHETNGVNDGIIKPVNNCSANIDQYEMIFKGPQLFVSNPLYKQPRAICSEKGDYDIIDIVGLDEDYSPYTVFLPSIPLPKFFKQLHGFQIGVDDDNMPIYDNWFDYYKLGFRKMLNLVGERTLIGAIIPPKSSHINGIISIVFRNLDLLTELAGLTSSLVLDFFLKTINSGNLTNSRMDYFPLGIDKKYKSELYCRTLRLNCLTNYYRELWSHVFDNNFKMCEWSIRDERLSPFYSLYSEWTNDSPLRNAYERRQALVEIDVISAMALGLTFEQLQMIYEIQFGVLQQYEEETFYDTKGNIIFTSNRGLNGVGLDRKEWENIRGEMTEDGMTYKGTYTEVKYTITKSEIYNGKEVTFYPPFTRCDRVKDYEVAWAHFEKVFNKE